MIRKGILKIIDSREKTVGSIIAKSVLYPGTYSGGGGDHCP